MTGAMELADRMSGRIDSRAERHIAHPLMLVALVALIAAATFGHAARDMPAESNARFEQLDADRDGYVSRDEAKALEGFEAAFDRVDDDQDGKLDAEEFAQAQALYDRMRAEQFVNDSMTTARVKVALVKDPQVKALDVEVETHKGAVRLSGVVDDEEQARRAMEVASGVRGVTAIRNSLTLKRAEADASASEKSKQ